MHIAIKVATVINMGMIKNNINGKQNTNDSAIKKFDMSFNMVVLLI